MSTTERIAFAISEWRRSLLSGQRLDLWGVVLDGWLYRKMEPLVRFGAPAVDLLRAQQSSEKDVEGKGVWEVIIATITGHEDVTLTEALFAGFGRNPEIACDVVLAATSKSWWKELNTCLEGGGSKAGKASVVIATCHGEGALSALKRAMVQDPSNWHAQLVVQGLELRAKSGPIRQMSGHFLLFYNQ